MNAGKVMTPEQTKILNQFFFQFAELASQTLTAFVEAEERSDQVSIATLPIRAGQVRKEIVRKEILNKSELADRLGVCVRTINELQAEGMPSFNVRRRVVFDFDEVLEWLKDKTIKSRRKKNLRVAA